jgi:hypothetical protein
LWIRIDLPDPAFFLIADPGPYSDPDLDPDPVPDPEAVPDPDKKFEKNYSWKTYFYIY